MFDSTLPDPSDNHHHLRLENPFGGSRAVPASSNIKRLEEALLAAGGPSYVADLRSGSLVRALVQHLVTRPEAAPYDFREAPARHRPRHSLARRHRPA